jgi:ubiquinone/menaquinone biosynthesis C-methylase UbiE
MQFVRNFLKQIGNQEITKEDPKLSQLNEILKEASSMTTPKQLFEQVNDDYWFWLHTEGYRQNSQLRMILPSLPDEAIQLRFTGASGDITLGEAFNAYRIFKQAAQANLKSDTGLNTVLDFGCGWGRTIRFFLKDIEPANLWGIDCFPEAIQLCRETNKWCNFDLIEPMPPTSFVDNKFDLIYCYSVFSHLSEEAHNKWLIEFKRILKPGGILIATTRPREFIFMCAELRKDKDQTQWKGGAARSFINTEQALAAYDSGKYLYEPVGGGDVLDPSFYGETCIPKGYVLSHWTEHYHFIDYIDDRKKCIQNIIIVRK